MSAREAGAAAGRWVRTFLSGLVFGAGFWVAWHYAPGWFS